MRTRASAVVLTCAGIALVLGAQASSAIGSAPTFRLTAAYGMEPTSSDLAIGDLNGDGRPDVAVGHDLSPGGVSVFLNRGKGRFRYVDDYMADEGHLTSSVAIGDLNGDGKADLAAACFTGALAVLLGRGDGTFLPPVDYVAGVGDAVAISDVDGDGHADLVTTERENVSVLVNRGDGTFLPAVDYETGRSDGDGRTLAIGDLNADGSPDLVTPNATDSTVSVLLNRGDGTFLAKLDYPTGRRPYAVAIGDLNSDRKPEVVTANGRLTRRGSVSVLPGLGDGTLGPKRDYRVGLGQSVAIGDLNGDGSADLSLISGRGVSVLLNRGDGRFLERLDYSPRGTLAYSVNTALADLNGDTRLDVAVLGSGDLASSLRVLINTPGLCNVQYVKRLRLSAAKRQLARANCRVGNVSRAYSTNVKAGRVILQRPSYGAVSRGGAKVDLVVSRGAKR